MDLSSLGSLGGSVFSSVVGAFSAAKENEKAFQRQKELQEMQQEYNTNMWNATNEYNAPVNAMARYAAAGINPNAAADLLTGNSAQHPGTPAVPSVSSTSSPTAALLQGFGTVMQYLQQSEQLRSQKIKNDSDAIDLQNKSDFIRLSKEEQQARIDSLLANTDLSAEQRKKIRYEVLEILPQLHDKTDAEIRQLEQGTRNMFLEARNIAAKELNIKADTDYKESMTRSVEFDNAVKKVKADIAKQYGLTIGDDMATLVLEAMLSGKDDVAQQIVNSAFKLAGTTVKTLVDNGKELYNQASSWFGRALDKLNKKFSNNQFDLQ